MKNKSRAFTLIEILVVLVIISIVTMIAMLTFGDFGKSRKIKTVAERLATVLPLAEQEAMLKPTVLSLQILNRGYQFSEYKIDTKTQAGFWQPLIKDKILGFTAITSDIYLKTNAHSIFYPDGTVTPFNILIGFQNELPKYQLNVSRTGKIKLIELVHGS